MFGAHGAQHSVIGRAQTYRHRSSSGAGHGTGGALASLFAQVLRLKRPQTSSQVPACWLPVISAAVLAAC